MSSSDKKDEKAIVPDDHTIREHWRNNALRHSIEGRIQLAEEGDAHQAKQLLALFVKQTERFQRQLSLMDSHHVIHEQFSKDLLDYLCDCFKEILGGEKADISLNLTTGKKGRRKKDSQQVGKEVGVAHHVSQLMEKTSLEDAAEIIAEKENVSVGYAKAAYKKYMKPLKDI